MSSPPAAHGATLRETRTTRPLLVVGLDGASFCWLKPLAEQGLMPNVARLLQTGVHAPLHSTMPPLTPPGWATCLTGVSPRVHGLWDFVRRASAHRYELLPSSGLDLKAPWLWSHLEPGQRSVVLNLPFAYPAQPLHGALITGFDTLDRSRAAQPAGLLAQLEAELAGPYPFFYQVPARHIRKLFPNADKAVNLAPEEQSRLEAVFMESIRFTQQKLRAASFMVKQAPFHFFFVHLFETDHLSHEAWSALEQPEHPAHALWRRYAQALDAALGELLEAAERWVSPYVALVSDHGFGPCDRRLLLNDWLVEQGLLVLRDAGRARTPEAGGWERIDWKRTRAYAIQTGVYVNQKETHPQGCVASHEVEGVVAEVLERLRETLGSEASQLRSAAGEALKPSVRPALAPDLVLHLDGPTCIMGYGELQGKTWAASDGLEGYHRMDGIFVLSGAGLPAELKPGALLDPLEMVDCTPTFLHLLGAEPRTPLEGRVLPGLESSKVWAGVPSAVTEVETGQGLDRQGVDRQGLDRQGVDMRLSRGAGAAERSAGAVSSSSPVASVQLSTHEVEEMRRRLVALGYVG